MKQLFTLAIILGAMWANADGGNFITKSGSITFYSSASLEDIQATSNQVTSVVNTVTGAVAFKALMKSFQFEKALMQEHFNEKYVESDKFPFTTFKGKITDMTAVNFEKDGTYPVVVTGDISLHGVSKNISATGSITIKENTLIVSSTFKLTVADFNIKIPGAVKDNIAKVVEVTVSGTYEPLKK